MVTRFVDCLKDKDTDFKPNGRTVFVLTDNDQSGIEICKQAIMREFEGE